jgi:outer membrane biosynthesis protein TonB
MATKKKKAKKRKKPTPRTAASKKPKKNKKRAPTKPRKKVSAPKRKSPKRKRAAKTQAVVPPPKTFAQKVHDCDVGTEVWYRVMGVVTRGTIQGAGAAGSVAVLSSDVVGPVHADDLFETQAAAAAR